MCTVADGATWYLAATIADNTTTTTNLSISDANLAAATPAPGYNTTGSRPLFPRSATVPGHEFQVSSASGTNMGMATTTSSSQRFMYYAINSTANCNDGDRYMCNMILEPGTYQFILLGITNSSSGIVDLYVDGVLVGSGIDLYSASTAYNVNSIVNNVSVIGNGYHLIEWVVNGKNGSSSDYQVGITYCQAKQIGFY